MKKNFLAGKTKDRVKKSLSKIEAVDFEKECFNSGLGIFSFIGGLTGAWVIACIGGGIYAAGSPLEFINLFIKTTFGY